MAVGAVATLRWDREPHAHRAVVFSDGGPSAHVDVWPVFYVENTTAKPLSCTDVTIEKRPLGLFSITGISSDGRRKVRVTVDDDLGSNAELVTHELASSTKSIGGMLRIEALAVGGSDMQNRSLAKEVLTNADLTKRGDPTSLGVNWPRTFVETSRGVQWKVNGEPLSNERMYRYESTDTTADALTSSDLNGDVDLSWNSIDELGYGSFSGGFFSESPSDSSGIAMQTGLKKIDNFVVAVSLSPYKHYDR